MKLCTHFEQLSSTRDGEMTTSVTLQHWHSTFSDFSLFYKRISGLIYKVLHTCYKRKGADTIMIDLP